MSGSLSTIYPFTMWGPFTVEGERGPPDSELVPLVALGLVARQGEGERDTGQAGGQRRGARELEDGRQHRQRPLLAAYRPTQTPAPPAPPLQGTAINNLGIPFLQAMLQASKTPQDGCNQCKKNT